GVGVEVGHGVAVDVGTTVDARADACARTQATSAIVETRSSLGIRFVVFAMIRAFCPGGWYIRKPEEYPRAVDNVNGCQTNWSRRVTRQRWMAIETTGR